MVVSDIGMILAFAAIAGVLYPHVIYPVILWMLRIAFKRPLESGETSYRVTVCVAAYNEEQRIERCLRSILGSDFPVDRLSIIVGDDGSTDKTREIVQRIAAEDDTRRITLHPFPRSGKNTVISAIAQEAESEIVLFTDADVVIDPAAISLIVRRFADERVGGVVGLSDKRGKRKSADAAESGEAFYRSMEDVVNRMESEIASTVSSNGALYAIRREFVRPMPDDRVADDWMNLLNVIQDGKRVVVEQEALAVEDRKTSIAEERTRTVRTVSGGIATVDSARSLLLPSAGWVAFFLFSHRIMRWLSPIFLILLFVGTVMSVQSTFVFGVLFYGQFLLYAAALIGQAAANSGLRIPVISTCLFFVTMNWSFLRALAGWKSKSKLDAWDPSKTGAK